MSTLFKIAGSVMALGLLIAAAPPLGHLIFGYAMDQKLWVLSGIGAAMMLAAGSIVAASELARRLER